VEFFSAVCTLKDRTRDYEPRWKHSHETAGVGGILDIKDHIAKSTRTQNDFAAWREATPKHNELVDTILKSSLHLIVTLETGRQLLFWLTTGADPHAAAISDVTGILGSLNLHELSDAYWIYVSRKYGINSVTDLTQQQLLEQSTILQQCRRSPERLEQFRQLLSNTPPQTH